jgi:hypothetical protein
VIVSALTRQEMATSERHTARGVEETAQKDERWLLSHSAEDHRAESQRREEGRSYTEIESVWVQAGRQGGRQAGKGTETAAQQAGSIYIQAVPVVSSS